MLRVLANGLVEKWKLMHWPKIQDCMEPNTAQPMGLKDVQGLFYMFTAVLFLAIMGFTAESLLHKHRCHRNLMLQTKVHWQQNEFRVWNNMNYYAMSILWNSWSANDRGWFMDYNVIMYKYVYDI